MCVSLSSLSLTHTHAHTHTHTRQPDRLTHRQIQISLCWLTHAHLPRASLQVYSLSDPYGNCDDSDPPPVSRCQLVCETDRLAEDCGCVDVYMEPTPRCAHFVVIFQLKGCRKHCMKHLKQTKRECEALHTSMVPGCTPSEGKAEALSTHGTEWRLLHSSPQLLTVNKNL